MRCHSGKGSYTCSKPLQNSQPRNTHYSPKVFSFKFSFLADFFLFLREVQDKVGCGLPQQHMHGSWRFLKKWKKFKVLQQNASPLPGPRKHTVFHDALSEQQSTDSSCGKFPDLERRLLLGVPTRADHFPSHQHTSEQRSMRDFSSLFSFLSMLAVEQNAFEDWTQASVFSSLATNSRH